jgi:transposase-like protein
VGGSPAGGAPPPPAAAVGDRAEFSIGRSLGSLDAAATPDAEVLERPVRRRFAAEFKLRILREADACQEPGQLGALLRREGLYASHLTTWRRQRDQGALAALKPKRRGRKTEPVHPLAAENQRLRHENERLATRLKQAETIIDVQKKICDILGLIPTSIERSI